MRSKAESIIRAINKLFGDTSIPPEQTLAELQEIQAEVESNIDFLRGQIEETK